MNIRLVLLDSGGSNLGSVQAAFSRLGVAAPVTSDVSKIRNATHIILPGVGAAGVAMQTLKNNRLIDLIPSLTQPLMGICVGMQLLFEFSEESDTTCLGLLPGHVKKMPNAEGVRVPHMGWNTLEKIKSHDLMNQLDEKDVYYVHSYAAEVSEYTLAKSHHGQAFSAIVQKDNVMGAQFHPERSSVAGSQLLKNFLSL